MSTIQKFKVILAIFIICIYGELARADTKVLSTIRIVDQNFLRDEIISLEDDMDLVVKGLLVEKFNLPNAYVSTFTISYVADKNGYRAKYVLEKQPDKAEEGPSFLIRLSIKTLQSLAG